MTTRRPCVLALAAAVLCPVAAPAQVISRPGRAAERVTPAPAGTRTTQSLNFSLDLLAGHDDNSQDTFATGPAAPILLAEPTYTGSLETGLDYRRSRGTKSFGLLGRASVNTYHGGDIDIGPTKRAALGIEGTTPLGRSNTFSISERLAYDQLYSLATFGPIASDVQPGELPINSPTQGVADLGSFIADTGMSLDRRWSRRDTTTLTYGYVRQFYTGEGRQNNSSHRAGATYAHAVSRYSSVTATYGYSNGEYAPLLGAGGAGRALTGHSIEGGVQYTKRISPRRALQLAAGLGASYADAITGPELRPYSFWSPSGHASARIDVARSWALSGNFRRGTSALEGLTGEAYSSNAVGVSLGGMLPRRIELVITGGYAAGAAGAGSGVASDYTTTTGAAQLSVPISRQFSAVVQYSYYHYAFTGDAALPAGFPSDYDRNSARIGLSWRLPIIEAR